MSHAQSQLNVAGALPLAAVPYAWQLKVSFAQALLRCGDRMSSTSQTRFRHSWKAIPSEWQAQLHCARHGGSAPFDGSAICRWELCHLHRQCLGRGVSSAMRAGLSAMALLWRRSCACEHSWLVGFKQRLQRTGHLYRRLGQMASSSRQLSCIAATSRQLAVDMCWHLRT